MREKATEAVVFLSSPLDRMSTRCTAAPVCWFTKGYSLDCSTMRNVAEYVRNEFAKKCIHIPAISFDGLWHNISVRDATNRPLTN
ncbi:hypothetical protein DPMN_051361 [Dreissena polymorpha]|uniref:Uncharacterized protein n=1 Tax=Dreissena polymorpha TaxID=45954 RepID=A0A9D4HM26_DREPO|nr:hypothetical protein DPMN_051361 [Dreissena polymorpha]